jgi:NADH dehydrogenase
LYGGGDQPISWISYRDVARAAVSAIIDGVGRNAIVELGGPEALSPREVVRMFEAAGAGEIMTESVPVEALQRQLETAPDPLEQSFAGLMLQYAAGDAVDTAISRTLFPFQMTSVRDFISATLAAARG